MALTSAGVEGTSHSGFIFGCLGAESFCGPRAFPPVDFLLEEMIYFKSFPHSAILSRKKSMFFPICFSLPSNIIIKMAFSQQLKLHGGV